VATEMAEVAVAGHHQFEIADGSWARLALKFKRIRVLPPVGKARRYPPLTLTVIHAKEVDPPGGRKQSIGNCSPTCLSNLPIKPLRRWSGTQCVGRSSSSSRS